MASEKYLCEEQGFFKSYDLEFTQDTLKSLFFFFSQWGRYFSTYLEYFSTYFENTFVGMVILLCSILKKLENC